MSLSLKLTLFEKFELAVNLLMLHRKGIGVSSEILSPFDRNQVNFRPQLQIATGLIQQVRTLISPLLKEEAVELARLDELLEAEGRQPAVSRLMRVNLRRLRAFDEDLTRAQALSRSLLKLTSLSAEEYDAFGCWLEQSIRAFKRDRCWTRLRSQWLPRLRLDAARRTAFAAVEDPTLSRRIQNMLRRLFYILALVRYVDGQSARMDRSDQILSMVHCYFRSRAVFVEIDDLVRALAEDDPLREMLTWCGSALKLEASRAFKGELKHIDAEADDTAFDDRLGRALSIQQNALEQTLRHVFQTFDPEYDSGELGRRPDEHYDETVKLLDRLNRLTEFIESVEPSDQSTKGPFLAALEDFRECWLPSLFRRDRKPFEALAQEVTSADDASLPFALHRLQIFISTLASQVKNRSVLDRFETQRTTG